MALWVNQIFSAGLIDVHYKLLHTVRRHSFTALTLLAQLSMSANDDVGWASGMACSL